MECYYFEITIDSIIKIKCMFILIAIFLLIFNIEAPRMPSVDNLFNSLLIGPRHNFVHSVFFLLLFHILFLLQLVYALSKSEVNLLFALVFAFEKNVLLPLFMVDLIGFTNNERIRKFILRT